LPVGVRTGLAAYFPYLEADEERRFLCLRRAGIVFGIECLSVRVSSTTVIGEGIVCEVVIGRSTDEVFRHFPAVLLEPPAQVDGLVMTEPVAEFLSQR